VQQQSTLSSHSMATLILGSTNEIGVSLTTRWSQGHSSATQAVKCILSFSKFKSCS
jgi:hypothetical protein